MKDIKIMDLAIGRDDKEDLLGIFKLEDLQQKIRIYPMYNGGLGADLNYHFSIVIEGLGDKFKLKRELTYAGNHILKKIKENKENGKETTKNELDYQVKKELI